MRSVVVKEPGQLNIESRPVPVPGAHEVRVKIAFAGICGSDVHIYHGHNPFAKYPRVIGHEFYGIIDAVGEQVSPARIGERVAVDPRCQLRPLLSLLGRKADVCTQLQVIGVHRDGGFSDYACVPAKNAWRIPEAISAVRQRWLSLFTIAANITAQLQPTAQDIALVYGAGPMGLTIIQALKGVYGVKQVIVVDRIAERLQMARENGADLTLDNTDQPLAEQLAQRQLAPTLVIDAACHPAILQEAILLASPAARIGILGFSGEASTLTQQSITSKEISIFSSRLNSGRFPLVIDWMEKGLIRPEALITHCMPLEQVKEAMEIFANDRKTCCKVLLQLG
ncbi:putative dehydrogenase, NAD(P)-binding, starvation-sensing protein [Klebsiella pneumoniae]|uniref:Putative dehydrogenase, NAD(P)-binding, starvation-sensing protein n=1 Tax=Klebsiella pneumoniae TaxID=573 RepID=A0A377XHN7_KLEPN|nr:putative dehydrogenase, NAD(P)-binding, starvation-sensing protein [Klebsiella pneumoniae]